MDSFFLSETLKYLYLLFDDAHWVENGNYLFTTEGHIFNIDEFYHNHPNQFYQSSVNTIFTPY